jgi:hypothetical protein
LWRLEAERQVEEKDSPCTWPLGKTGNTLTHNTSAFITLKKKKKEDSLCDTEM